jgi:alpha-N-arabinofuranosidase
MQIAFVSIVLIASLDAGSASAQASPANLTIHVDQPIAEVSPALYSLMTEEISHSYEGGLYAEIIHNSTFRSDWSGTLDWMLVEDGQS